MNTKVPFKRLVLRAVLRHVSPMVIRVLAVPDHITLSGFDAVFQALLGWEGFGFSFHIHGQEFSNFMRSVRRQDKTLGDFKFRHRETFMYTCGGLDLWEWELRLLESEPGNDGDDAFVCLAGQGAAPPEYCGGPRGYRLMLKRQEQGESMFIPAQVEAVIAMLTAENPEESPRSWDILRSSLNEGIQSLDERLERYGPLDPNYFDLKEANQRLLKLMERRRYYT